MSGGNLNAGCTIQDINAAGSPGSSGGGGGDGGGGPPVTKGSDGSTLLITNPTVANVLDTNTKQYGAIGGCVFLILICCVIILFAMGGDSGGSSGANAILARLSTAGS